MALIPLGIGLGGCLVFLYFALRLARSSSRLPPGSSDSENLQSGDWSQQWFESFSTFSYLPMRRLLSPEEEEFCLRSNVSAEARARYRKERRRIFNEYLRMMAFDVRRLSRGIRLAAIHAPEDRSEEILRLIRLERTLRQLIWQAKLRLVFHWLGVQPIDVTHLIDVMQGLEFSLREIRINPQPV